MARLTRWTTAIAWALLAAALVATAAFAARWQSARRVNAMIDARTIETMKPLPDDPRVRYAAAWDVERAQRYDEAIRYYTDAQAASDPALASRAWFALGNAYFQQGIRASGQSGEADAAAENAQFDLARDAYRSALEIEPNDVASLDALSELYRELQRWSDLGDLYLSRAESSLDPSTAAGYRLQLARLRANELADTEGAIDQLEEIVRELPGHAAALEELEKLRRQGVSRERIVGILLPLYASADDWRRLIKLNEDRFAMAEDASDKVAVLRETAELWERRGDDLDRARRGLAVAFELDPDNDGVRQDYERLVEATGAWDELCGVYQERLKSPDLASRRELLGVLADAGIVRHRGKIEAAISNAQRYLDLRDEVGSLAAYAWSFEPSPAPPVPQALGDVPPTSPESVAMSKDLKKRGWRFVGPTTVYAFMQAMGLVDDHLVTCPSRAVCEAQRATLERPQPF